jgi:hypothetical protein
MAQKKKNSIPDIRFQLLKAITMKTLLGVTSQKRVSYY